MMVGQHRRSGLGFGPEGSSCSFSLPGSQVVAQGVVRNGNCYIPPIVSPMGPIPGLHPGPAVGTPCTYTVAGQSTPGSYQLIHPVSSPVCQPIDPNWKPVLPTCPTGSQLIINGSQTSCSTTGYAPGTLPVTQTSACDPRFSDICIAPTTGSSTTTTTSYIPWIIGGVAVLLVILMMVRR